MTDYCLSFTNKEVFEFYQKHSIDFEQINLLFYNILQQIYTSTDNSYNANIASTILTKITNIEQSIIKQQNEFNDCFLKLDGYRKD